MSIGMDDVLDRFVRTVLVKATRARVGIVVMVRFTGPMCNGVAFIDAVVVRQASGRPANGLPWEHGQRQDKGEPTAHGVIPEVEASDAWFQGADIFAKPECWRHRLQQWPMGVNANGYL